MCLRKERMAASQASGSPMVRTAAIMLPLDPFPELPTSGWSHRLHSGATTKVGNTTSELASAAP